MACQRAALLATARARLFVARAVSRSRRRHRRPDRHRAELAMSCNGDATDGWLTSPELFRHQEMVITALQYPYGNLSWRLTVHDSYPAPKTEKRPMVRGSHLWHLQISSHCGKTD